MKRNRIEKQDKLKRKRKYNMKRRKWHTNWERGPKTMHST